MSTNSIFFLIGWDDLLKNALNLTKNKKVYNLIENKEYEGRIVYGNEKENIHVYLEGRYV